MQDSNRLPWVHISSNLGKHTSVSVGEDPPMMLSASDLKTDTLTPARRPMSFGFHPSTSSAFDRQIINKPVVPKS